MMIFFYKYFVIPKIIDVFAGISKIYYQNRNKVFLFVFLLFVVELIHFDG